MSIRINKNISALTNARHLENIDQRLSKSLERLSSGLKINRGSDSPSGLIISEQIRSQLSGLHQALANAELDNTMVQTAEGALGDVTGLLMRLRQIALQAGNEGANDDASLQAMTTEFNDILRTLNDFSRTAKFGKRNLFDGSSGIAGEAIGPGIIFVRGNEKTKSSPTDGYAVKVEQTPSQPYIEGSQALEDVELSSLDITINVGDKFVSVRGAENETPETFFGKLSQSISDADLPVTARLVDGKIRLTHFEYGSDIVFKASSSIDGVLSEEPDKMEDAVPGRDIKGTIGGSPAHGDGQLLTGIEGSDPEGLTIRYEGTQKQVGVDQDGNPIMGREFQLGTIGLVYLNNSSPRFQVSTDVGQNISISLPRVSPANLGTTVVNRSNFSSLADARIGTLQNAVDSVRLVNASIDEINLIRGKLGSFQKYGIEQNINTLRVATENLMAADSVIRDADLVQELVSVTTDRLRMQASASALSIANHKPSIVIDLIR